MPFHICKLNLELDDPAPEPQATEAADLPAAIAEACRLSETPRNRRNLFVVGHNGRHEALVQGGHLLAVEDIRRLMQEDRRLAGAFGWWDYHKRMSTTLARQAKAALGIELPSAAAPARA